MTFEPLEQLDAKVRTIIRKYNLSSGRLIRLGRVAGRWFFVLNFFLAALRGGVLWGGEFVGFGP